ncbi:MAG: glycosyltransferase family 4 protein [Acidobacteriota bacterium]|nr:glycosyltransferase family 4 protein [Acidobacteriota bacterium]
MRIAFLSHYFPPEIGAPAARVSELARVWAESQDVTVLTGFPNHPTGRIPPEYRGRVFAREQKDGYAVFRCWLYATPNEGFSKRTLGHLSFMATSFLAGAFRLRRPDVLVATSPTFFSVFSAWALGALYRAPFVFEVRDLWPGIFVELGILKNRTLIRILETLELWLYRRAALVVTVTRGFAEDIIRRGIPGEKVVVIPNGADLERYSPGPARQSVRERMGAGLSNFLVLYIGAHGISHALERILEAAERLRGSPRIRFAFVGEGARKADLVRIASERGLANVIFLPGQPRDAVPDFYRAADLCLVPLRDVPLFSTFIPSKMFEIMACARPIVASVRGEAGEILEASGGAVVVPPEAAEALADAVEGLSRDPGKCAELGLAGRRYVEEHFDRRELAGKYLTALERIA